MLHAVKTTSGSSLHLNALLLLHTDLLLLNVNAALNVHVKKDNNIIYGGTCTCRRQVQNNNYSLMTLLKETFEFKSGRHLTDWMGFDLGCGVCLYLKHLSYNLKTMHFNLCTYQFTI